MNKEFENELQDSIKKHLPEQVGAALKERLTKIETLEKEVADLTRVLKLRTTERDSYSDQLDKQKTLESLEADLKTKDAELKERERILDVSILKIQLEEANKRADQIGLYTSGLVRNINFRKTVFDHEMVDTRDNNGNYYPKNTTKNYNETQEDI